MQKITTIGLDLAKSVFQVHSANSFGKPIHKKALKRDKVLHYFANIEPCLVGMEACGGAHHWARKIESFGHTVKIIPAQYVKPYVKTNKNDVVDAEAISEAVTRPSMRFVSGKSVEQQDIQFIHRVRSRLIKSRTALSNEIRGILTEYGIVGPKGIRQLRKFVPREIESADNELSTMGRELLQDLYQELTELDEKVSRYDKKINDVLKANQNAIDLTSIPGIGPLAATALKAKISNPTDFKNGRQLSAFLGLVPKQFSSGGKTKLLSISKRGDPYLRQLLILGAKSALRVCDKKDDPLSKWASELKRKKSPNVATVAMANKITRIACALMKEERSMH